MKRPTPSQHPLVMVKPPEPSEELRLLIAEMLTIIIKQTIPECFRNYIDDVVNCLRALALDPYGEVVRQACDAIYELSSANPEILFHFTVNLGRSTFRALTH